MKKKRTYENLVLINHPLVKKDITILRNKKTNTEIFRAAVTRISNIIAVEISTSFSLKDYKVQTPLESTKGYELKHEVVLIPVLRA
ncbi:MAG: uracil phosphoribosyltransferase, partial [Ignavibacteriaceae bacterium]|nr:uracil phosphoribosyltransferase [Ignavibacteriaceae bacterium]